MHGYCVFFYHRPAGRMRSAVRESCVCWVSARTPLKEKKEPSAKSKATVTATYAAPSMKVSTSKEQNFIPLVHEAGVPPVQL